MRPPLCALLAVRYIAPPRTSCLQATPRSASRPAAAAPAGHLVLPSASAALNPTASSRLPITFVRTTHDFSGRRLPLMPATTTQQSMPQCGCPSRGVRGTQTSTSLPLRWSSNAASPSPPSASSSWQSCCLTPIPCSNANSAAALRPRNQPVRLNTRLASFVGRGSPDLDHAAQAGTAVTHPLRAHRPLRIGILARPLGIWCPFASYLCEFTRGSSRQRPAPAYAPR